MSDNHEAVRKHEEIVARTDLFKKHVDSLKKNATSLVYAMIATDDGFPVAYTEMDDQEAMRKAAVTASLNGLSSTVAQESNLKKADATHIECEAGFVFSRIVYLSGGKEVGLLVAANGEENFATLLWHIKKMVTELVDEFARS
ncbi:MAG: roadblock/LC7 domain-containing protein [Neisseria sp.]|nr:roadblock/LC7 domain-containing protein [Neisseria sp.]